MTSSHTSPGRRGVPRVGRAPRRGGAAGSTEAGMRHTDPGPQRRFRPDEHTQHVTSNSRTLRLRSRCLNRLRTSARPSMVTELVWWRPETLRSSKIGLYMFKVSLESTSSRGIS